MPLMNLRTLKTVASPRRASLLATLILGGSRRRGMERSETIGRRILASADVALPTAWEGNHSTIGSVEKTRALALSYNW